MISARVVGLASFASEALKFEKAVKAAAASRSATIAAEMVEDMRANVSVESGATRDSIRAEQKDDGSTVVLAGGTPETTRTTTDGKTYDVARLTEFGSVDEAARPFFRPAIERARQKYGDAVVEDNSGDA